MTYTCQSPVLLLLFNRPAHAATVLERIRSVRPARLYVHGDGPRSGVEGEQELVEATRQLIGKIDWECDVKTLFRPENLGLRDGVSGALDWFFSEVEHGIILEDDCLPDPSFFRFCDDMLDRYQNTPAVMHIGGYNPAFGDLPPDIGSYFFSKFVFVWGWASWKRAWKNMRLDLDGLSEFATQNEIAELSDNPMIRRYILDKFETTRERRNNSWAYAWFYSVLRLKGLAIVPAVNLIRNTGVGDVNATNTNRKSDHDVVPVQPLEFPLIHPAHQTSSPKRDNPLFYHSQKSRWRLPLWYCMKTFGLR